LGLSHQRSKKESEMRRVHYQAWMLVTLMAVGANTLAQSTDWVEIATQKVKLDTERAFCIYVADLNNDLYPDMITVHGDATENVLRAYLNVPDNNGPGRTFVDITSTSGINAKPGGGPSRTTLTVALADINNDGNVDMVRGNYYHRLVGFNDEGDRCEVLLGDGQGHFTLVPDNGLHELGLINCIGFSFLDYDKDGNVDLFIAPWFKDYDNNIWSPGFLMKGNGDGTFSNVSAQAGITTMEPMYGCSVVDWNNDGWPDILTAPYCRTNGQLLKNNGNGTFTNVAAEVGYNARYMQGDNGQNLCMWIAAPEDYDNDGDMDLFFSLVHGGNDPQEGRSTLVLNGGAANNYALTPDRSLLVKKAPQSPHNGDYDGSWFDLDNDGWMDLVMAQGTYAPTTDRLYVFHHGADHKLTDVTGKLGLLLPGLLNLHLLEAIDYDLDGDDDIVVCRTGQPRTLELIENKIGQENNWTAVSLRAPVGVNKSSIGARIYVWSGGTQRMREVYAGRGNASGQQPFTMIFGLGSNTSIDSITVVWPDASGTRTTVRNPPVNRYLQITSSGLAVQDADVQEHQGSLKVYPNPARDFLMLQMSDNEPLMRAEVFDMLGRKGAEIEFGHIDKTTYWCSVATLPAGRYFVKAVSQRGSVYVKPFVKLDQ
jgi:hypothetical protein